MDAETTTKFKGDIVFNDGEKDILVSDLATVEEVNEALNDCVTNDKVDTYTKMLMNTEPTEPLYLNPNFDYKDDHVMSSKAVKELIDKNNESAKAEYEVSLNESLTTTLNDYGTKEWINNITVPQYRVINENNTALYPILEFSSINEEVNVKANNLPKRLKIESNETYNGIYEYTYTEYGTSRHYYENEEATENGYRLNVITALVQYPITVNTRNGSNLYNLDIDNDGLFIQYEDSEEWTPLTVINRVNTYCNKFKYRIPGSTENEIAEVLHVFNKRYAGVYRRDHSVTSTTNLYYRNDSNITIYLGGTFTGPSALLSNEWGHYLDESTGEKEKFTDDVVNEIYFEKEIEVNDKTNYIPSVYYVENQCMQTLLDQIKSLEERIEALESLA